MQLYYKISEVSQIPMKYIINDAGVIKDANKLRGVKNKVVPVERTALSECCPFYRDHFTQGPFSFPPCHFPE